MTQDEAEKLAYKVTRAHINPTEWMSISEFTDAAREFAGYILSGDMRREIENAAYELAIAKVKCLSPRGAGKIQQAIRALIQPSAQKENGK